MRAVDDDYGVGSCSPGLPRLHRTPSYRPRTHYRANTARPRVSCDRDASRVKWSDDPREVDCKFCKRAELWEK
jgi:hypothetical protein